MIVAVKKHALKKVAFSVVRTAHDILAKQPLPDRLGVYFHALEKEDWPAFRQAISTLRGEGYTFVSVNDYIRPATNPGRRAFISFDDNYKSWYEALPLLDELDVRATFYTNTLPFRDTASGDEISDYFDRIDHHSDRTSLTRGELKEMRAAGHSIGCHSHTHYNLAQLPRSKWDAEILQSKRILEDLLGEDISHFAYPFGMRRFFSEDLRRYCLENGFGSVAAAAPGLQYTVPFDPKFLHRTRWVFQATPKRNLDDIRVDGRWFEKTTGLSAVG